MFESNKHICLQMQSLFPEDQFFCWDSPTGQRSISGVSPNFEITVACGLKFHWYLRTLSLNFQKARTKIEVSALLAVSAKLRQPTGQRQENFNFGPSLLKF